MPTTTNRTAVKAALKTALAAAFPSLQVSYGWPGDAFERECIYIGASRGTFEHHDIRAGRRKREDDFTIDVWFVAGQDGQTAEEADARCESFVAGLDGALATDWTQGVDGLRWARVGDYDGPDADVAEAGWASLARAEVVCNSLLQ